MFCCSRVLSLGAESYKNCGLSVRQPDAPRSIRQAAARNSNTTRCQAQKPCTIYMAHVAAQQIPELATPVSKTRIAPITHDINNPLSTNWQSNPEIDR
jgi:hypothetical protein